MGFFFFSSGERFWLWCRSGWELAPLLGEDYAEQRIQGDGRPRRRVRVQRHKASRSERQNQNVYGLFQQMSSYRRTRTGLDTELHSARRVLQSDLR